ncbi:hypothetical protein CHLRE_10g430376v5 [Chlamydomonas reinhardtii]|uniref:Uncharacterized protein n=1 Tax=Chlamydomonas reinhardtii TaxID=3055 RepID=A0A2K3D9U4_CHLRE|nr:uncharacterized protein CHLRE_10g430376v5 [Chlamydomonas reinhardtii]PNW77298.1 hypothetical protein CHLRE_10g430376v5 [Chlamydomonas reinhardtii]
MVEPASPGASTAASVVLLATGGGLPGGMGWESGRRWMGGSSSNGPCRGDARRGGRWQDARMDLQWLWANARAGKGLGPWRYRGEQPAHSSRLRAVQWGPTQACKQASGGRLAAELQRGWRRRRKGAAAGRREQERVQQWRPRLLPPRGGPGMLPLAAAGPLTVRRAGRRLATCSVASRGTCSSSSMGRLRISCAS